MQFSHLTSSFRILASLIVCYMPTQRVLVRGMKYDSRDMYQVFLTMRMTMMMQMRVCSSSVIRVWQRDETSLLRVQPQPPQPPQPHNLSRGERVSISTTSSDETLFTIFADWSEVHTQGQNQHKKGLYDILQRCPLKGWPSHDHAGSKGGRRAGGYYLVFQCNALKCRACPGVTQFYAFFSLAISHARWNIYSLTFFWCWVHLNHMVVTLSLTEKWSKWHQKWLNLANMSRHQRHFQKSPDKL